MLAEGAAVYRAAFVAGLKPDPIVTVSEWADEKRFLSSKAAAEPGRWDTSRTPYLREMMDVLSAYDPTENVVFMKGAQIGGSEAGFNWIGYVIDQAPGPMMMIQPSLDLAKDVAKQRIVPLIDETPTLAAKVKPPRERDSGNTTLSKEFPGGVLFITGANSAAKLRSKPIMNLFCDEVDAYPGDVEGEGDPVNLARARTRTFARRKIFLVSTPTISGRSRIEAAFQESDQRYYRVPCPHCDHKQVIRFANLKWEAGRPETVALACEGCGALIEEHHKTAMLAAGEWVPENPGHHTRGYHLSSLYSPLGWYSWREIARDWEAAQGKPDQLRTFVNTVLGECWQERGDAPEWKRLYERRAADFFRPAPRGVLLVTAGIDVQKDRIEAEICGWGREQQSWSLDYVVLPGDTSGEAVWADLDRMLARTIPHESGIDLPILRAGVDTGYNTQRVYAWARFSQHRERVMLIKGQESLKMAVGIATAVDINWQGRRIDRGVKLWPVGVDLLKTELYGRLRLEKPTETEETPFGWCNFPPYGEEYFKQLTAEQKVAKVIKGFKRYHWEKTRERNEALDCRIYNRAAAVNLLIEQFQEDDWLALEAKLPANDNHSLAAEPVPKKQRRKGGWLDR